MPGRLWAFSMWACDQSGPRERSSRRATTRSPSCSSERAPISAMRGSEPGSSRSSSRKVRRGTYSGPSARRPRLLPLVDAQRVVLLVHLPYAGLGVVGRELAPHHRSVEAAGHQGHAVHVPGQIQGEGLGDGDGLEQVLDAQQGALPGARRRHRQQHGVFLSLGVSEQQVLRVQLQCSTPLYWRSLCVSVVAFSTCGSPAATQLLPSPPAWPRCGPGSGCPLPAAARLPWGTTAAIAGGPGEGRRRRPPCLWPPRPAEAAI